MNNRNASVIVAFVGGVALYQAVVVYFGGFLAAIAIPKAYFEWFGRPHLEVALGLVALATFAVPVALLVAGGTLALHKLLRKLSPRTFMLAITAGALVCFAYWSVSFLLFVPELPPGVEAYPMSVRLKQLLFLPLWAAPNFFAPWLGLAMAGWLIKRAHAHRGL